LCRYSFGFQVEADTPSQTVSVEVRELHMAAPNPAPKIFVKKNIGADVQAKIEQLQNICYSKGMTEEQVLYTLALVDHESAGTYSTTIKGDKGCSVGIAQWNKCVGRIAGKDFEAQSHQICDEMKAKYDKWALLTAITKHNCPRCTYRAVYVNKILSAIPNFN